MGCASSGTSMTIFYHNIAGTSMKRYTVSDIYSKWKVWCPDEERVFARVLGII